MSHMVRPRSALILVVLLAFAPGVTAEGESMCAEPCNPDCTEPCNPDCTEPCNPDCTEPCSSDCAESCDADSTADAPENETAKREEPSSAPANETESNESAPGEADSKPCDFIRPTGAAEPSISVNPVLGLLEVNTSCVVRHLRTVIGIQGLH